MGWMAYNIQLNNLVHGDVLQVQGNPKSVPTSSVGYAPYQGGMNSRYGWQGGNSGRFQIGGPFYGRGQNGSPNRGGGRAGGRYGGPPQPWGTCESFHASNTISVSCSCHFYKYVGSPPRSLGYHQCCFLHADPAQPDWAHAGNEEYGGPSSQRWVEPGWEDGAGSWNQTGWDGAGSWSGFQNTVPMQSGRGRGKHDVLIVVRWIILTQIQECSWSMLCIY